METCMNWCGPDDNLAWVSTDERKWITRLRKLNARYPEAVRIRKLPEANDGCLCLTLPREWIRIYPPRVMSENKKQQLAEQLKTARAKRGSV